MANGSRNVADMSPDAGWAALADARWADARKAFTAALEANEAPEVLEGLSWAAWWLDDADSVFESRERAFSLYRKLGDIASAGRMATWLAADYLDFRGAFAVASGWLRRARRLLEPLDEGPDHGWLAFHEGYVASMQGDTPRSLELAVRAAEIGRRAGVADLHMLGLALQGAGLVACAKVEEGMGCLDEAAATALTSEAMIPISRAWTCCFLVSACEAVRDYERAFEWCDKIAEFSQRYGSRYMLGFCRAHYGAVRMWRGQWHEAEANLQAAVEDYSRSRPAFVASALLELAELRRRQGNWEECERLLDEAGGGLLCRARLAFDRGEFQIAGDFAARALRQTPEQRRLERAAALELLVRTHVARDELPNAQAALAELEKLGHIVSTAALRAAVEVAAGIVATAEGDHERARQLLEDAADHFADIGAPFEAAQAKMELATSLLALGRRPAAEREVEACLTSLGKLGAMAELRRAQRLLEPSVGEASEGPPLAEVTRREREVLRFVAEGLTNRQIAARLGVSDHTVHRHVTNILRKLRLTSRTAAAAHAVRLGLAARSQK
ncbi:MAG: LuxR C-terminal-related transcriptional regulator [Gemmatimonadaceae bacterium]